MADVTVSEQYLALLREAGIKYLFVNSGTDIGPIAEAYAANVDSEVRFPRPVLAAHENLVVGMAHGAYLITGEPQALMVHVGVGTANAACGVINAARERVPLFVTAGRSPVLEDEALGARDTFYHWGQEMYDQGGLLREFVKWDYELRDSRQVAQVVDRALSLATTDPQGPVYLTLPREVLATNSPQIEKSGHFAPARPPAPDPQAVAALAEKLGGAELPLIVTSAAGADPSAVSLLEEICSTYAIGVVEVSPRYLNVSSAHPLRFNSLGDCLPDADVLLVLDCEVPWIPKSGMLPRRDAFIAQVGVDPAYQSLPIRSHRSDLTITAGTRSFLSALSTALDQLGPTSLKDRHRHLVRRISDTRDAAAAAGESDDNDLSRPITGDFISRTLAQCIDENAVVFNEYPLTLADLERRRPGTYFSVPASGGLGWGLPAALGAKLAAPDRTIVAAVGDGSYFFGNPAACHHAAQKYHLPVLTLVANNEGWSAVDYSVGMVYPAGAVVNTRDRRFTDMAPLPALEEFARAAGGFGERVSKKEALKPAIEAALFAIENEGRQALLNIECK